MSRSKWLLGGVGVVILITAAAVVGRVRGVTAQHDRCWQLRAAAYTDCQAATYAVGNLSANSTVLEVETARRLAKECNSERVAAAQCVVPSPAPR